MNTKTNQEPKRWVLLEHLPYQHSRRLLLILFLYALAFTLLLVGLRMFCHDLSAASIPDSQKTTVLYSHPTAGTQQDPRFLPAMQNHPVPEDLWNISPSENTAGQTAARNFQNARNMDDASQIQQDIADHIIRLHVIAHSDTNEDQALKLKVRDKVLSGIQDSLKEASTKTSAKNILEEKIPDIQKIALSKIRAEGYDYPVHVVMENRYFPAKTYGNLTFPPGTYQALCIEIGAAQGKNWWCVLFPSLCFVDETTAEVPEPSRKKLEDSLSEEAYQSLANQSTPTPVPSARPEFHSAIYDWFRKR